MPIENAREVLEKWLQYWAIWAIWAIAMQLNQVRKGERFKFWMLIANIGLAMWIGYIAWSLIPDSVWELKYSIISICWFLSYPMLDFIEKKGLHLILKRILWIDK